MSAFEPATSRPRSGAPERVTKPMALLLAAIAISLAVESTLHLARQGARFDPDAGTAEAVIGVVLAAAAIALWRTGSRARRAALWANGFAIVGFCVGLRFTAGGGYWPDLAYHLAVLPLLVLSFVALLRADHVPSDT